MYDACVLNLVAFFHPNFRPESETRFGRIVSHVLFRKNVCSWYVCLKQHYTVYYIATTCGVSIDTVTSACGTHERKLKQFFC